MYNEKISYISPALPMRMSPCKIDYTGSISSMHFHSEPEILHVTRGALKCTTADSEYIAGAGDVIFLNKNTPHQTFSSKKGTHYRLLQFRIPDIRPASSEYLNSFLEHDRVSACVINRDEKSTLELIGYLDDIFNENQNRRTAYDYYLTANIYMITALFHRTGLLSSSEPITDRVGLEKLLPAIEYIDTNYRDYISLDTLCRISNLTKYYFCHAFKKATGSTAIDYLNFVRIQNACELLKGDDSITSIAYNVGFSSPSYFNSVFNKYKFCSPKEYRKMSRYGQ